MRRLAGVLLCVLVLTGQSAVESFPGAKIKDQAPYNQTTMMISQTVCQKIYTDQELLTQRLKVVPEVKACVARKFSALQDVDFAFATSRTHEKCIVPDRTVKSAGGLTMWPVCCPIGRTNARQFLCISYVVPGSGG